MLIGLGVAVGFALHLFEALGSWSSWLPFSPTVAMIGAPLVSIFIAILFSKLLDLLASRIEDPSILDACVVLQACGAWLTLTCSLPLLSHIGAWPPDKNLFDWIFAFAALFGATLLLSGSLLWWRLRGLAIDVLKGVRSGWSISDSISATDVPVLCHATGDYVLVGAVQRRPHSSPGPYREAQGDQGVPLFAMPKKAMTVKGSRGGLVYLVGAILAVVLVGSIEARALSSHPSYAVDSLLASDEELSFPPSCRPQGMVAFVGVGNYRPEFVDRLTERYRRIYGLQTPQVRFQDDSLTPRYVTVRGTKYLLAESLPVPEYGSDEDKLLLVYITDDPVWSDRFSNWIYSRRFKNTAAIIAPQMIARSTHVVFSSRTDTVIESRAQRRVHTLITRSLGFIYCGLSKSGKNHSVLTSERLREDVLDWMDERVW